MNRNITGGFVQILNVKSKKGRDVSIAANQRNQLRSCGGETSKEEGGTSCDGYPLIACHDPYQHFLIAMVKI